MTEIVHEHQLTPQQTSNRNFPFSQQRKKIEIKSPFRESKLSFEMTVQDSVKWNEKYQQKISSQESSIPKPNTRLSQVISQFGLTGTTALDLACGLGGNSFLLARSGYTVDALDISEVAIRFIKEQQVKDDSDSCYKNIRPTVVDLDEYKPEKGAYDLVVVTYFLDRRLFDPVKECIKVNGLVFMETFYAPIEAPPTNATDGGESGHSGDWGAHRVPSAFKLEPDELNQVFSPDVGWEILFYQQDEQVHVQSILARKMQ